MSMTTDNPIRNGVDTATLFATLDAVKGNTEIAKFQFRATNRWVSGTHNQSTIHGFYGAMQEMAAPAASHVFDADHPAVLVGTDNGPTPVEYVLHALGRLPHGRHRQHRRRPRREPHAVESTVEGDIDLLGILGLGDERPQRLPADHVSFKLGGDDPEKLRKVVEQSRRARPSSTSSPTACPSPSRSTPADPTLRRPPIGTG